MKILLKIIIYILVVLSLSNLAVIFLFHQEIAEYINADIVKASLRDTGSVDPEEKPVIRVTDISVSYNGRGSFDVMKGISAVDIDGVTDITDKVNAFFVTENKLSNKVIRYTVIGSNGNVGVAERKLTLMNYTGPSIQVPDNILVSAEDLDDLVTVLKGRNEIKAEDGFGNDITGSISYNYEVIDAAQNKFKITFTISNYFSDVRSQTIYKTIEGAKEGPSLVLSRRSIVLKTGDAFNPIEYIQIASDPKDGDLLEFVRIQGSVDTQKKGQYAITYSVTNSQSKTATARLVVYVN